MFTAHLSVFAALSVILCRSRENIPDPPALSIRLSLSQDRHRIYRSPDKGSIPHDIPPNTLDRLSRDQPVLRQGDSTIWHRVIGAAPRDRLRACLLCHPPSQTRKGLGPGAAIASAGASPHAQPASKHPTAVPAAPGGIHARLSDVLVRHPPVAHPARQRVPTPG